MVFKSMLWKSEHSTELGARQFALFGQLDLSCVPALQLVPDEDTNAASWDKEERNIVLGQWPGGEVHTSEKSHLLLCLI